MGQRLMQARQFPEKGLSIHTGLKVAPGHLAGIAHKNVQRMGDGVRKHRTQQDHEQRDARDD